MPTTSILDGPPAKTPAELVARTVKDEVRGFYRDVIKFHNRLVGLVFESDDVTPQEAADSLGTYAAEVYQLRELLKGFTLEAKPSETGLSELPEGIEITVNPDGTLTITP